MRVLILFITLLFIGCASTPPVLPPAWVGKMDNACLPEAAIMRAGLRGKGINSHILLMYFQNSSGKWGHAVCVYFLDGTVWAWDSTYKSLRIFPHLTNAESEVAAYLEARKDLRNTRIIGAQIL